MKKIALMMLVAIAAIACNPEEQIVPEIKVTTTEFTLPLAGTEDMSFKVEFNANVDWTAALKEVSEWCTITPASGVAGDAYVTVIALENPTEEQRTATLVLTAGTAVKELVLTQEAVFIPRLAVDPAGVNIAQAGGSATATVTANVAYTVTAEENDWLTVAQDGNTVTFTATANEDFAARGVTVTFATEYAEVGGSVYVYQEGRATKLWSKAVSELDGFDPAQRTKLAKYGPYLVVANTTKVYGLDPVTGEVAMTINMPEGFNAHNVIVDDAGNFLIASDAVFGETLALHYVADPFNPNPELVFAFDTNNYYGADCGNIRVRGNIKGEALITATISDGAGAANLFWEVTEGVCSTWYWTSVPYPTWTILTQCAAPAGTKLSDGIFYIGYGGDYNLYYAGDVTKDAASTWVNAYTTGSSWMENYNAIATAEWNGHKYLAILAGCHFNYDDADAILLNVDEPTAAQHVYTYAGTYDVTRDDSWANQNWTGAGTHSDILLYPTEDALVMTYVDANYGAMASVAIK